VRINFLFHRVIRYEDLSLEPYKVVRNIFQFYGLPFDQRVTDFLDTHTNASTGNKFSTSRDSKSGAFKWTKDLSYNEVNDIQKSCKIAMELWGYKEANNDSELQDNFNPLLPFNLL
jgi:Sulfotransferase domain